MKRVFLILLLLTLLAGCAAQTVEPKETTFAEQETVEETEMNRTFYITIGETRLEAVFAENPSAEAFAALLAEGDVTVQMQDYSHFEKVGALGTSLPRSDRQITTEPGDVILYQGDQITIYYDVNSWSFTRLGKIQNITQQELMDILGDGDVTAVFSLD